MLHWHKFERDGQQIPEVWSCLVGCLLAYTIDIFKGELWRRSWRWFRFPIQNFSKYLCISQNYTIYTPVWRTSIWLDSLTCGFEFSLRLWVKAPPEKKKTGPLCSNRNRGCPPKSTSWMKCTNCPATLLYHLHLQAYKSSDWTQHARIKKLHVNTLTTAILKKKTSSTPSHENPPNGIFQHPMVSFNILQAKTYSEARMVQPGKEGSTRQKSLAPNMNREWGQGVIATHILTGGVLEIHPKTECQKIYQLCKTMFFV